MLGISDVYLYFNISLVDWYFKSSFADLYFKNSLVDYLLRDSLLLIFIFHPCGIPFPKRTEDHTKLGTSAVASKEKIWSNFRRVCTQIYIHIFSFSLVAIWKFSGRCMTTWNISPVHVWLSTTLSPGDHTSSFPLWLQ